MLFGGPRLVSHDTFRAILRDLVKTLLRHGFKDILISNCHGGNENAMRQIVDELTCALPDMAHGLAKPNFGDNHAIVRGRQLLGRERSRLD